MTLAGLTRLSKSVRRQLAFGQLLFAALAAVLVFGFFYGSAAAASLLGETKLTASDGGADDWFGNSVAVSDGTVVVGAYQDNGNGATYVYKPDGLGGYVETKLTASDGAVGDRFGWSVAISDGTIVVGAHAHDDNGMNSGSAYVYEPDGLGSYVETKLTASDGAVADRFGWSVAVSDGAVVVGAYLDDDNGMNSGSAYVYERDSFGGYVETKLSSADGAAGDFFGVSVAVADGAVVIGAPFDDDDGSASGAAYVYDPDGLGSFVETKLTASDGAAGDLFAYSVASSGNIILIGNRRDDDNGMESGSAYVYERDGLGGFVENKLTASDGAAGDDFGLGVAVSGGTLVVGAYQDDDNGNLSGSAYVFQPDGSGGYVETKLTASDGIAKDLFGLSVAVSDGVVVVGAPRENENGTNSGSAYVFGLLNPDTTPPVIEATVSGTIGDNGWYTSDINVTWSVTDPESPITWTTGCDPADITTDTAGMTLTCEATSDGGSALVDVIMKRDTVAPTASASAVPEPNTAGWNDTDVTVSFTGTDTLSGISSCNTDVVLASDGAGQSASGTCSDLAGNTSALASVNGINIDKTAPKLVNVDGRTVETASLSGAVVDYAVAATDNEDPIPLVACFPVNNTLLPLGDTDVSCTATDEASNESHASFTVTVELVVGGDTFDETIATVEGYDLANGTLNSFVKKLSNAAKSLNKGDVGGACDKLTSFVEEANAQDGKKLTVEQAAELRTAGQTMIAAIGC